ncbi:MAG: hypothetical protein MIO87_01420 [Methanomassiliicoccales archaeon]|nr:hypothetical protein [Methanomassiliicoccales archaeon]TFG55769.1 MAG: hypothetical protein E4H30_06490 [Methanomassiliicoccus sp.]
MTETILFTKPDCQKCDYIKARLPDGLDMRVVNTSEAEGLAEAAYYELLNRNLPILVVDDEVFEGAIIILNKLKRLAEGQ